MRASIVVVLSSVLLFSVCLADFSYPSFTQAEVDQDFSVVANAEFDSTNNALQIVPSRRNLVGAAFHVNYDQNGDYTGEYIAPGFITQFTFQINAITGLGGAGLALVLQPNSAVNLGTTGAGIGYGDYQNKQQGIFNSLAIEFDVYLDQNMNDPNNNHAGVHSTGDNAPNSSNENAVILGLVNSTIPAIQNSNGTTHTVYIEYQGAETTLVVFLDDVQILNSTAFNLTEWILLEPGSGESFIGITGSTNQNDFFELDILSWYFWQGNGTVVPDATQIFGPGFVSADYNTTNTYYIQLIDNFGYNITSDAASPTCALAYGTDTSNITSIACSVSYVSGGLYQASYFMSEVGQFTLITTVDTYVNTTLLVVTGPPAAANTVASGQGLTTAIAGEISTFTITTYDASNSLSTGDAFFTITLTLVANSSIIFTGQASAPDGTGVYTASYNVTISGDYSLSVILVGQTDIQGSPFSVIASAGPYSPANSFASGPGITSGIAGESNFFLVQAVDAYGNLAASPSSWNITSANANPLTSVTSVVVGDAGITNNTYIQTVAGSFPLSVTDLSSGIPIFASPFTVQISAGAASPANTVATGALTNGTAGVIGVIIITPFDQYGNAVNNSSLVFSVNFTGAASYSTGATYNSDGTYTANYNLTLVGNYQVSITLVSGGASSGEIASSPFTLTIFAGALYVPNCFAYGQGLTTAEAGVTANFTIQSVDTFGNNITTAGSADFVVTFDANFTGTIYPVVPNADGTYTASYVGNNTGTFAMSVTSGTESISGSPFSVTVTAGPAYGPYSVPSGPGLSSATAGETSTFSIAAYDEFDNPITSNGGPCTGYLQDVNDAGLNYTIICNYVSGNNYTASYNVTVAGDYQLFAFINGDAVQTTPTNVTVSPGPLYPPSCTAFGPGIEGAVSGVPALFNISATDQFGNVVPGSSSVAPPFEVVLTATDANATFGIVTYIAPGLYLANYTLAAPTGSWSLNVSSGGVSIQNSPFAIVLAPGAVSASNSYAFPDPLPDAAAYEPYVFYVQAVDINGNNETTDVGVTFEATITPAGITVPSTYYQNGQYAFNFNLTSGSFNVAVSLGSTQIKNSPLPLTVTAGLPAANFTIATGLGLSYSRAGDLANFTIITKDLGGVSYTMGNQNFSISLTQTTGNETITANVTLVDNEDGTYSGQYNVTLAAIWELSINLTSGPYPGPIVGSPFLPNVVAGPNCPENAQVNGLASNISVNAVQTFLIQSKDCYGNDVLSADVYYDVLVEGPDCSFANSTNEGLGVYNVTYMVSIPGNYSILINERGVPINGSPFPVTATGGEEDVAAGSERSSSSLIFMWLMIVFIILYVIVCLLLIGFVVVTQRKQLQRNFSNYKKIHSDSSSSSSSD